MDVVHLTIRGATRSADTNQVFLVHLVSDLRQLALRAAYILHNELVKMLLKIAQDMLALDDRGALRVGAHLSTEVLEDGGIGHTQGTCHVG